MPEGRLLPKAAEHLGEHRAVAELQVVNAGLEAVVGAELLGKEKLPGSQVQAYPVFECRVRLVVDIHRDGKFSHQLLQVVRIDAEPQVKKLAFGFGFGQDLLSIGRGAAHEQGPVRRRPLRANVREEAVGNRKRDRPPDRKGGLRRIDDHRVEGDRPVNVERIDFPQLAQATVEVGVIYGRLSLPRERLGEEPHDGAREVVERPRRKYLGAEDHRDIGGEPVETSKKRPGLVTGPEIEEAALKADAPSGLFTEGARFEERRLPDEGDSQGRFPRELPNIADWGAQEHVVTILSHVRVAILLKDLQLSGGVSVVVTHARNLVIDHGFDVTLVTTHVQDEPDWPYDALPHLHILPLSEVRGMDFDIALSTWWETAYSLFQLDARRYASFVQSLEDRFYEGHESVERLSARLTLDFPVAFITEAGWIAGTLAELRPDADIHLVRNGIDKEVFAPVDEVRPHDGPLRVLVEGSPESWFKAVPSAIKAVDGMEEPHELTLVCPTRQGLRPADASRAIGPLTSSELASVYSESDVIVKLSRVEGMYGPPLEAFHKGATCVTTEVTGHEEYIRHGFNALVCDWDDLQGTAAQLDMLARDRELLLSLRRGALETARDWPDWLQSSAQFARALEAIAEAPRVDPCAQLPSMLQTLKVGLEEERGARPHYRRMVADASRWQRINSLPVLGHLLAARRAMKDKAEQRRNPEA